VLPVGGAVHALTDHFPGDRDSFPGRLAGGKEVSAILHMYCHIVIGLFLTPYMTVGKGDIDRIRVVRGSGTFTEERYCRRISL
jgi:hypothetical protein